MATAKSNLIIKHYDGFGGNFLDSQYLGNAYEPGKPYVFMQTLSKVFSSQNRFFTGKPLIGMTMAKSYGTKEIDTEIYRWTMQGAEEKLATILEVIDSGNTTPGLNGMTFRIKLDLDYYHNPDVLLPEDPNYPLAIVDGPIQDGTGSIYVVRLQGDDPTAFVPTSLLQVGKEFSKAWTSVASEYNDRFGTQQVPNSFLLESQVGAFAQSIHVTDKALRDSGRLAVEFLYTDPRTGKESKVSSFLPLYEARMHDELYMGMEAAMIYGKKETKPGDNGYWIKTGPGLREQLRDSWVEYYSTPLTTEILKDYLLDIFFSRTNESDRKVTAMTGTLGSLMFHDMLAAEASAFFTIDSHFIQKASTGPSHLSFGAQFTHYRGPEGIEVTLLKNPFNDSKKYCKRVHPLYVNMPIDSARMTFLDFGTSNGSNNIQMLTVKDTYRWGYLQGTVGPNGPIKGGQVSALKAGYDVFTEGTAGLWIQDVTRCGELIYSVEY